MFGFIKNYLNPPLPDPELVAAHELQEARLHLLSAEKRREHYDSEVSMLRVRIDRLKRRTNVDNV